MNKEALWEFIGVPEKQKPVQVGMWFWVCFGTSLLTKRVLNRMGSAVFLCGSGRSGRRTQSTEDSYFSALFARSFLVLSYYLPKDGPDPSQDWVWHSWMKTLIEDIWFYLSTFDMRQERPTDVRLLIGWNWFLGDLFKLFLYEPFKAKNKD